MKETYQKPITQIDSFTTEDVITTSSQQPDLDIGGGF
jgi:hypothetical protein